jgi:murein DD-endopeptidase MepM/ murein hydrolase activator NlpD
MGRSVWTAAPLLGALIAVAAATGCGSAGTGSAPANAGDRAAIPATPPAREDPIEALARRGGRAAIEPPAGGADSAASTPGAGATPDRSVKTSRVSPGAMSDRQVRNELEDLAAIAREQSRVRAAILSSSYVLGEGSGIFVWPVHGPITSPFCEQRSYEACHPGIDIAVPTGTPIHAADRGVVLFAGSYGGYGNFTCIGHSRTLTTCYAHQSQFLVGPGDFVDKGKVIGLSGSTGNSTGPHVHFEVRINGKVVDPMLYL